MMVLDKPLGCLTGRGGEGVSRREGGYPGCSAKGNFSEEEVYGEKVSMGFQHVTGHCGEGTSD